MLATLIGAASYFFYGSDLIGSFAGWAALLVFPAALGGLISQLSDPAGEQSPMGCIVWPTAGLIAVTGISWLVLGEGAICIAMVLPLWIPAAIGGGLINRWNAKRRRKWESDSPQLYSVAWLALPMLILLIEHQNPPSWREEIVTREILIDASPDKIWPLLISIPNVSSVEGAWNPTHDLLGVPRPTQARLVRTNGQLVRKAQWGTDVRFEERIVELQPARKIGWTFAFPDQSIQKHTDRHVSPDGDMLKIISGGYELTEVASHTTRVRLRTKYKMGTRLPTYLAWWADRMLGDIQANVLTIVKDRTSKQTA